MHTPRGKIFNFLMGILEAVTQMILLIIQLLSLSMSSNHRERKMIFPLLF